MTSRTSRLKNLIVVACHAPFKGTTLTVPAQPEGDEAWVLQSFQIGEPPLYIAHIKRGVELLKADPGALLIFSGGYTRPEAGLRWSEAETYRAIAKRFDWWSTAERAASTDLEARTAVEDYSRDSFENLLFSLCRFQQVVGQYPHRVTLVSWAFKRERFGLHREAIRFPTQRFSFDGFNEPIGLDAALRGEAVTMEAFGKNHYGSDGTVAEKRIARNPFKREHDFRSCPDMGEFFQFMEEPSNRDRQYPARIPWEE
ncbi:MAG TPA: YdcF family protein [Methylomirabilota bacterium]|nr:YdcF family protein [Methylomirabilota bacterium]